MMIDLVIPAQKLMMIDLMTDPKIEDEKGRHPA